MSEEQEDRPHPEIVTAEQLIREGWHGLEAPTEPAERFTLLASSNKQVDTFLRLHGCEIQYGRETDTLIYPSGTTRQRIYPTITDDRFWVYLPDGIELREVYRRFGANNLLLPREAVEREVLRPPAHREET